MLAVAMSIGHVLNPMYSLLLNLESFAGLGRSDNADGFASGDRLAGPSQKNETLCRT